MNRRIRAVFIAAVFALIPIVRASARVDTKGIAVEFPSDLPEASRQHGEAMFLYPREDQSILYLEQDKGRSLVILDVSDPGTIRSIGQVAINAPASFDFVQYLGHSAELIHYRNHSGFATISFKDYKQPVLRSEPHYLRSGTLQINGPNELLLVSGAAPVTQLPDPQYEVVNVSDPANPTPLTTIQGVIQRIDRPETGTVFLLTDHGLYVVRCLDTEQHYEKDLYEWYR